MENYIVLHLAEVWRRSPVQSICPPSALLLRTIIAFQAPTQQYLFMKDKITRRHKNLTIDNML